MFPNGGAWLTTHIWQHYLNSRDVDFLKEYYPVIKGTADFYLDYMRPGPNHNKWLVVVLSTSRAWTQRKKYDNNCRMYYGFTNIF